MFGYVRLLLAAMVLASHTLTGVFAFNPGIAAVISFYMLAGFVVCGLITERFQPQGKTLLYFYGERGLRIFPLYLYITAVSVLFLYLTRYGDAALTFEAILGNALIVPLTYSMLYDGTVLMPYAWSLGVELHAYLILPFVLRYRPVKIFVGAASLCIYILAALGHLPTNAFGYMLPPGVLFIFILGITIHKRVNRPEEMDAFDRYFPELALVVVAQLILRLALDGQLLRNFATETAFGILLGYPTILWLAKRTVTLPFNHLAGELSYGVFLAHAVVLWGLDYFQVLGAGDGWLVRLVVVFALSLALAGAGVVLVDRNLKGVRYALSRRAQAHGAARQPVAMGGAVRPAL